MDKKIKLDFGFIADASHTTSRNAQDRLASMETWNYFNRPTNMAFHDLTSYKKPPRNLRSLLGLSLKFIPTPRKNTPWHTYETNALPRFERSMRLKAFFATRHSGTALIPDEDVVDHEDDLEDDQDAYNKRMYIPSGWEPPVECKFPPPLQKRLDRFKKHLRRAVHLQRGRSNLLQHQQRALATLQDQEDFLIVQCDKNLGPAVIERDEYIRLAFRDHLNDQGTYVRVHDDKIVPMQDKIFDLFDAWFKLADRKKFYHQQNIASSTTTDMRTTQQSTPSMSP